MKKYFLIILVLVTNNAFANSLVTKVDRQNIELGDIITLIVQTDFQSLSSPDFSNLQDQFEILGKQQSNQITMINGSFESHTRWDLRLTPKQTGDLVIPPFKLGNVASQPIKITVSKVAQNQRQHGTSFFEAKVDTNKVFVQQQIIYTLHFYHLGVLIRGNTRPPLFKDAIAKQLVKQTTYEKTINGNNYEVYEWKWAVFPQKSGELKITPQIFTGQIRYNGRMKRVNDLSGEITIRVKPIPPSYPKQEPWLPATNIKLAEQWSLNNKIRVGDSITRTMQMQASGLQAAQLPEMELENQANFHSYPDKAKLENQITKDGLISQATRDIAIVPTDVGNLAIPNYKIHWWNTTTNQLEIASLAAKTFTILPALNKKITTSTPKKITAENKKLKPLQKSPKINLFIWQILTLVFAIAWLVTLFLWLKQKNKKTVIIKKPNKIVTTKTLDFCNQTDPKIFYQQLNIWLKQQTNETHLKKIIQIELQQLQTHLFNNQSLNENCLIQICQKIQNLPSENQDKLKPDKLDQLYL